MAATHPFLITGCPRSGTTWVGSTVGASPDVFYVYEPFNDDAPHHLALPERHMYLDEELGRRWVKPVRSLVELGTRRGRMRASMRGVLRGPRVRTDLAATLALSALLRKPDDYLRARRVCFKDPLAFFAAEWLNATFGMQVVVMLRHPAG